jgi:hypothetical protein
MDNSDENLNNCINFFENIKELEIECFKKYYYSEDIFDDGGIIIYFKNSTSLIIKFFHNCFNISIDNYITDENMFDQIYDYIDEENVYNTIKNINIVKIFLMEV